VTTPRATYRLQLSARLRFASAQTLIPYLRDLGVSHLYLSPSLQARPGSPHGYDVTDPLALSDDLGGGPQFRNLADAARSAGMGLVLDLVPNHMFAGDENRFWVDPKLRAQFFDLDPVTGRHRRFFDVDDLAGVREEDPEVFAETHALALALIRDKLLDGLRIDHPDGLADPPAYFARLRERGASLVWIEKILESSEPLRDWPVSGTVGYEFLNDVCALFIDPAGEEPLTALWEQVSGDRRGFGEVAVEAKLEQLRGSFSTDVEWIAREGDGAFGTDAIAHALASLTVYRTYVEPVTGGVSDEDRRAVAAAQMDPAIAAALLLERDAPASFVTRFQQTTPAIMAKGVEDTAFYRYGRLLALNEVGGDPSRFGIDVERFHTACLARAERFPVSMLTTQTHDTKRSGDVRARIAALASMATEWREQVGRWFELTESLRTDGAPDDVERYFLFQTLVGAWPIEVDRVAGYMLKALREAKRNTNWVNQNTDWEQAVDRFTRGLYSHEAFLREFEPYAAAVAVAGDRAAHAQLVLKLTAPGIPDIYQGDELAYRALVDPDNRRPVDWEYYQSMLARLMGGGAVAPPAVKLFLIVRLLGLRARRPEPFAGAYEPLAAGDRACAFVRGGEVLVAVGVRDGASEDVLEAPRGRWLDVLRGGEQSFAARERLGSVLGDEGYAVFERVG
jgi:(1->4)-alpha-D-glucan 1-alpha-D-glucosylmutase